MSKKAAGRFPIRGAVLHSDRGSQYTSVAFRKELLYRMAMDEVKTLLFRYVFIYYNQYRAYTSNPGGLPPAAFRISALGYAA